MAAMKETHPRLPATEIRPGDAKIVSPIYSEGAGNAGRSMRPQPRVVVENTRVSHHGHTGNTRHSPRNGFTASFELSLVIGLFVTIISATHKHCRQLDISVEMSGPHDFAVRLSVHSSRARQASIASRTQRS
jgi:hypothetical protein